MTDQEQPELGYDYDSVVETTASVDSLAQLGLLAQKLRDAQKLVVKAEMALKVAKTLEYRITTEEIPELMEKCKVTTFTTDNGFKIEIKKNIRANITAPNKAEAHAWLITNGHGGMIKTKLASTFTYKQSKEAAKLQADLEAKGYDVETSEGVHASTLSAFVKKELEAGRQVPMKVLSVFDQKVAKVTNK